MKRDISTIQNNLKNKKRKHNRHEYTDISPITDKLFIGNKRIAKDIDKLKEHGITHVINCAVELEHYVEEYDNKSITWLWLPMYDCSFTGNVADYIEESIKFIDETLNNNNDNKILIHCAAGISRSSSITIAYLMYKHNLRYERAFSRVVSKRSCCKPNSRFVEQLKGFDFTNLLNY